MLVGPAGGAWAYCESSSCSVFLIGCLEEVCLGQEDSEAIMMTHLREGKGGLVACHKGAFFQFKKQNTLFARGLHVYCQMTTKTNCGNLQLHVISIPVHSLVLWENVVMH